MMPHMARYCGRRPPLVAFRCDATGNPCSAAFADIIGRLLVPGELAYRLSVRLSARRYFIFWYAVNRTEAACDVSFSSAYRVACFCGWLLRHWLIWSLQKRRRALETGQIIAALLGDAPRNITLCSATEWRSPAAY